MTSPSILRWSHAGEYIRLTCAPSASCKRVGRRWRHVGHWSAPPVHKLRETARRAVYALGLHFGAVDLGGAHGAVVRVAPDPPLDDRLARRFARAMETYVATTQEAVSASYGWTTGQEVVLGADPEFILRIAAPGRTVSAARFFSRWGVVGLDRACFKRNGVLIYPLAEVRPPPSPDPLELVENLRRAFARAASAVRGHRINFRSRRHGAAPLHHRGTYPFQQRCGFPPTCCGRWTTTSRLPVLLLENPVSSRLRRPRYGYLGDWRPQPHGGFEYRTPGSWVISPQYAAAVLCLAKAVAQDYPLLRRNVFLSAANQRAFYAADKAALRPHFFPLWNDLERVVRGPGVPPAPGAHPPDGFRRAPLERTGRHKKALVGRLSGTPAAELHSIQQGSSWRRVIAEMGTLREIFVKAVCARGKRSFARLHRFRTKNHPEDLLGAVSRTTGSRPAWTATASSSPDLRHPRLVLVHRRRRLRRGPGPGADGGIGAVGGV